MKKMKKIVVLVLVCLCLLCGCDEIGAGTPPPETEKQMFGLTEKELEAIEDILGNPYVGEPHTLDDVAEITCLGYDKMYVDGEWVESKHLIEYKVIFKNGETKLISINKVLLED